MDDHKENLRLSEGEGRPERRQTQYSIQQGRTISISQFCEMSGMCKTTTHKLIKSGELKSTLVGNRRLISLASAMALINPDYAGDA